MPTASNPRSADHKAIRTRAPNGTGDRVFVPLTPAERAELKERALQDHRSEASMARLIYMAGIQAMFTGPQGPATQG